MHTFAPNKLFGQILDVSPKIFLLKKKKILNSELSHIELWFTDQKSTILEIEDKINGTLVINWGITHQKWCTIQFNLEKNFHQRIIQGQKILHVTDKYLQKIYLLKRQLFLMI